MPVPGGGFGENHDRGQVSNGLVGHVDISGSLKPSSREDVVFVTSPGARVCCSGEGLILILQSVDTVNGYSDGIFKAGSAIKPG